MGINNILHSCDLAKFVRKIFTLTKATLRKGFALINVVAFGLKNQELNHHQGQAYLHGIRALKGGLNFILKLGSSLVQKTHLGIMGPALLRIETKQNGGHGVKPYLNGIILLVNYVAKKGESYTQTILNVLLIMQIFALTLRTVVLYALIVTRKPLLMVSIEGNNA